MIFVFGSNEGGIHGAGAALYAIRHHGAVWGQAAGRQGHSYGIPTVDRTVTVPLTVPEIQRYVDEFIEYAKANPNERFQVTQIGCGLAGYNAADMAPLFIEAPPNCVFDSAWAAELPGRPVWRTR